LQAPDCRSRNQYMTSSVSLASRADRNPCKGASE
jgi:hypothetical protein